MKGIQNHIGELAPPNSVVRNQKSHHRKQLVELRQEMRLQNTGLFISGQNATINAFPV
jgi:hypothetical protein